MNEARTGIEERGAARDFSRYLTVLEQIDAGNLIASEDARETRRQRSDDLIAGVLSTLPGRPRAGQRVCLL